MNRLEVFRSPGKPILHEVLHARNAWQRLRGLLGRKPLGEQQGLLITPCNSVHTIGMRYALDVVFLDRDGRVLKCIESIRPFRAAGARGARHALELAPGTIARTKIRPGEQLAWKPVPPGSAAANGTAGR